LLLFSLLGNRIHQLIGILALAFFLSIIVIIIFAIISLRIRRRLANDSDTTQGKRKRDQPRDKT